jgi:hypothetical protein
MKPDASECKFSVQNALKLTYKHPETGDPKKILDSLSIAIKRGEGREGRERRTDGRTDGRGKTQTPQVF